MNCDLEPIDYSGQAGWRVGHAPTPWRFTDWSYAGGDGRFDGRWDDPDGSYRVLCAVWKGCDALSISDDSVLGCVPAGERRWFARERGVGAGWGAAWSRRGQVGA